MGARKAWLVGGGTLVGLGGLLAFNQVQFGTPWALADQNVSSTEALGTGVQIGAGGRVSTGAAIRNPYGSVQVKIRIKNGRIIGVRAVDLPVGDSESASISKRVAPRLAQAVIDAQSADIANISGATYTTDGYRQSVQSALDRAAGVATNATETPTTADETPNTTTEDTPVAESETTGVGDGTATGASIPNRWGAVQVQVTVEGGRIVDVSAVDLPYGDRRSAEISDYSAPILAEQVLAAQSANVDGVSGASYTSDGYRQSVQSALDQLRG